LPFHLTAVYAAQKSALAKKMSTRRARGGSTPDFTSVCYLLADRDVRRRVDRDSACSAAFSTLR